MGLAIVSRFLRLMGGAIQVESPWRDPGDPEWRTGSAFHFTVVCKVAAPPPAGSDTVPVLPGCRVLIALGDPQRRGILADLVTGCGLRPLPMSSPAGIVPGIAAAVQDPDPPSLVIVDSADLDSDPYALAETIHHLPGAEHLRFIVLHSLDPDRGCTRFDLSYVRPLHKPVRRTALHDALFSLLSGPAGIAARPVDSHPARPLRVLLAEDNPVNQILALRLLEKHSHTVSVASTGLEALALLQQQSFDVVLMDVQMPGLGGLETVRHIREQERSSGGHMPVVAMTACAVTGDRERCLAAGMDDYLSKPIRPAELYALLEAVAGGSLPQAPIPASASRPATMGDSHAGSGIRADLSREQN